MFRALASRHPETRWSVSAYRQRTTSLTAHVSLLNCFRKFSAVRSGIRSLKGLKIAQPVTSWWYSPQAQSVSANTWNKVGLRRRRNTKPTRTATTTSAAPTHEMRRICTRIILHKVVGCRKAHAGPDKFECIGRRRSAWCKKAELSGR